MFCAADQSTPEIQAATIHWEHTGRRTAFWKRIKPNRANKSLNIWPHAGLPGGYVRSSGSEVSYLPLFSLENSASKFALLTGQDQISDTRIGGLLPRFECLLFFFFYLNGRGFLLPGNLENDCICLKKKKKSSSLRKMWGVVGDVWPWVCWSVGVHVLAWDAARWWGADCPPLHFSPAWGSGWERAQSPWDRMVHRRLVVLQRRQEATMGSLAASRVFPSAAVLTWRDDRGRKK